ncbi:MAG: pseudouridine-5'-phosphate glycosidase, partial [Pseudomonadota bacterium]
RASSDVSQALAQGKPLVALESTIIAHGMPFPRNLETAREVENVVRQAGAIPATIAVLEGQFVIGLTEAEIEQVARSPEMAKLSRRDLAIAVAQKSSGATTVAATMIGASMAGIRLFATGGIGGVHRGAEESFDISADLDELGRTPVAVVSAGAKAILDLPKTLEVLETKGVPVIGYRTDEFPAFYSSTSGLPVPHRCDDPTSIAAILRSMTALGQDAGMLIANPIPADQALEPDHINAIIEQALMAADQRAIAGRDVTPFLLAEVAKQSDGESLEANIALVKNNARLAAEIARAL